MIIFVTVQSGKKAIRGDRKGFDGRDHGRKSISEDLVSVINDGLYFYEQVKIYVSEQFYSTCECSWSYHVYSNGTVLCTEYPNCKHHFRNILLKPIMGNSQYFLLLHSRPQLNSQEIIQILELAKILFDSLILYRVGVVVRQNETIYRCTP